jgi:hypothetical protein
MAGAGKKKPAPVSAIQSIQSEATAFLLKKALTSLLWTVLVTDRALAATVCCAVKEMYT